MSGEDTGSSPKRPTRDDIPRLGSGSSVAIGCFFFVALAIVAFVVVRVWIMG